MIFLRLFTFVGLRSVAVIYVVRLREMRLEGAVLHEELEKLSSDGVSVDFFKSAWMMLVGQDFCSTVSHFFDSFYPFCNECYCNYAHS